MVPPTSPARVTSACVYDVEETLHLRCRPNGTAHPSGRDSHLPWRALPFFLSVFFLSRRGLADLRRSSLLYANLFFHSLLPPISSMAALLVRILLIRGGVHPHPGPTFPCTICGKSTWRGRSCSCCTCGCWTHLRCAGIRERQWSPTWTCASCSAPVPTPSSPSSPLPPSPPPPSPPPTVYTPLNLGPVLQWNCNGLRGSRLELIQFISKHKVAICALQESKLNPLVPDPHFPGYALLRRDRPGGGAGGGLAFLIREDISFLPLNSDSFFVGDRFTEHLSISVSLGPHPLHIVNLYIPPSTSCPADFTPSLGLVMSQDTDVLILGDFNAHHQAWFSATRDDRAAARGTQVVGELDSSSLCLLNCDIPTRRPTNGEPSSPDLSLISAHLATDAHWNPVCALNSDHVPILITIGNPDTESPPGPMYSNFRKADWEGFRTETEAAFTGAAIPVSCSSGEKIFRAILQKAAGHHIPRGRRKEFIPNLSEDAKLLIRERDRIRALQHDDPTLPGLEQRTARAISESARRSWTNTVESSSHRLNPTQYWSLIKSLSGKSKRNPANQPITFKRNKSHTFSKKRQVAESFCHQFTSVANVSRNPDRRPILRSIKKRPLDHSYRPFTPTIVREALDRSGTSTAIGPDHLNILHLRNLGPAGISFLCTLFNLSVSHSNIPSIWKTAIIIPLLKPGKPASDGSSYRPISLLCPAAKVLERLLLPTLNSHLQVVDSQHGFRPNRSTTTALLPLTQSIATGFNQRNPPHRTVALAIDFSRAFDMVPHHLLLSRILQTTLPNNHIRWLATYLHGRSAYCLYNTATSKQRPIRSGVPQGSVISPCLFNFFVADYPATAPLHVSYADDFTAFASHPDYRIAASTISAHADDVAAWAADHGLTISLSKSHSTLFTPDTHQSQIVPSITLKGDIIPLNRRPKILGVTLDTHFTFTPHIKTITDKARSRLNILRALAGSSWGQHKETLILTYKCLIKSLFLYAAPIWFPNAANTAIDKLQVVQNAALRISCGATRMSSIDHLHQETQSLPVRDSLSLICSQFLARTLQPHHPSHHVVTCDPGPRRMKKTLHSRFLPSVSHLLEDGVIPQESYRNAINQLHSTTVAVSVDHQTANRVLLTPPPHIDEAEKSLPRSHRTALSQLRSGFCPSLNSYQFRVGWSPSQSCPECDHHEHSVAHLFQCPARPTALTPLDLWTRPCEVANHLLSLPYFGHLCPLPPPPPEPPPRV